MLTSTLPMPSVPMLTLGFCTSLAPPPATTDAWATRSTDPAPLTVNCPWPLLPVPTLSARPNWPATSRANTSCAPLLTFTRPAPPVPTAMPEKPWPAVWPSSRMRESTPLKLSVPLPLPLPTVSWIKPAR